MVAVPEPGRERGVYGITVAAELVGTGVQNLRSYEARGLLEPERTDGGTRRYSADDLDRLRPARPHKPHIPADRLSVRFSKYPWPARV